jgi:catechol 2,3-dioxygenase-like lactoylglutathione lyase family enzyme
MSIVQFDHIAIAAHRMADAPAVLEGIFGGAPTGEGGPSGAYTWAQWSFAGGARLEILEPRGDDGFLHRFLAGRGPGIHHVTFRVPGLDETCALATAEGFRVVGRDESDPAWAEAFLHPKEALGIVVQLVESRVTPAASPRPLRSPAGPRQRPSPVSILGVRMRARSAARADTLWSRVLGGRRQRLDGVLVYTWAGSPMRVAVDVDPSAEEGPISVEYAGGRPVGAAETLVLGTRFSRRAA